MNQAQQQQHFPRPATQNPKLETGFIKPAQQPAIRPMYITEIAKKNNWSLYTAKGIIKDAGIDLTFRKWRMDASTGKKKLKTFFRRKLELSEIKKLNEFIKI